MPKPKYPLCRSCIHGWMTRQTIPYYKISNETQESTYSTPPENKLPDKIVQKEYKGLCFWAPKHLKGKVAPIEIGNVRFCNRYEEEKKSKNK